MLQSGGLIALAFVQSTNSPPGTGSRYLPDAKLYLYAYRVYDSVAGRWTQRDPIDYQDSPNLYKFCGNNPVNNIDVDGRFTLIEQLVAVIVIGLAVYGVVELTLASYKACKETKKQQKAAEARNKKYKEQLKNGDYEGAALTLENKDQAIVDTANVLADSAQAVPLMSSAPPDMPPGVEVGMRVGDAVNQPKEDKSNNQPNKDKSKRDENRNKQ